MLSENQLAATADFKRDMLGRIRGACARDGHQSGWSMFASPERALASADIVFMGMNPGGVESSEPENGLFAPDGFCPFSDEKWERHEPGKAPLQKQVRALFACFELKPEDGLCGNLVPFRSRDWKTLGGREPALALGEEIWSRVFKIRPRPVVICMGRAVEERLVKILSAKEPDIQPKVAWGNVTASCRSYDSAEYGSGVLIRLPHLSRYAVIGRKESGSGLDQVFAPAKKRLKS